MNMQRQQPDGSWQPAEPLGWQGTGIDWEVYETLYGYRAEGYDKAKQVAIVRARTKVGLHLHMWRKQRQLRRSS